MISSPSPDMAATAATHPGLGRIVLVGCSGIVGTATMHALNRVVGSSHYMVCTRDPASFHSLDKEAAAPCVIHGDLNEPSSLKPAFEGAWAVFLITPDTENRVELVKNGLNAAKEASVPFILVLSVATADATRTILGKQFREIEQATKDSGIPYAIMRLPLFTDNLKCDFGTVAATGKICGAIRPTAAHNTVSSHDAGEAAAAILVKPSSHMNMTYTISGPAWTLNDAASELSKVLGRPVVYEHKSYEAIERALLDRGAMPAWELKGMTELWHMIDDGRYTFPDTDYRKLTGHDPMSMQRWLETHRHEIHGIVAHSSGTTAAPTATRA